VQRLAAERGFDDARRYELLSLTSSKLLPDFPINDRGRHLLADRDFRQEFEIPWLRPLEKLRARVEPQSDATTGLVSVC